MISSMVVTLWWRGLTLLKLLMNLVVISYTVCMEDTGLHLWKKLCMTIWIFKISFKFWKVRVCLRVSFCCNIFIFIEVLALVVNSFSDIAGDGCCLTAFKDAACSSGPAGCSCRVWCKFKICFLSVIFFYFNLTMVTCCPVGLRLSDDMLCCNRKYLFFAQC